MALTFTTLGTQGCICGGGERPLVVFPADTAPQKGSIVLLANPQEKSLEEVVSWPGEYNEAGISIHGIGHGEGQQVSYVVEVEGVRIAFLSSPLQDWTDKQLESVGDIDVLVLPADDAKVAQKLIDEFDPRVLILLPTKEKGAFDAIAKTVGVKPDSVTPDYKLKGSLPAEGREVVVLRK
jgi:hypothetical protein